MPKKILFVPENLYYEAVKQALGAHEKGLPVVQDKKRKTQERAKGGKGTKKQAEKPEKRMKNQESVRR